MKKMIVFLLAAALVLSLAACGGKADNEQKKSTPDHGATEADTPIDGGWSDASPIAVSSEVKAMFDRINETMTGAYYVPIVYLSSQVVAGTNHLVLCKEIPSTANEDALGIYALVTVYEDLQGNAEITQVLHSGVTAPQPYDPEHPAAGGWSEPETYAVTEEAKTAVDKAFETVDSYWYEPVALLGSQVVAGTNYLVLCKPQPAESARSGYVILTVYADLEGHAEATGMDDFTADEVDTGDNPDGVIDAESASSQAE